MNENIVVRLEEEGVITATFRRLAPAKKEKIFRAVVEIFAMKAFDRVALDEIAAKAKISKGSLVQYFPRKENLLFFVSEMVVDSYQKYWNEYFSREEAVRTYNRLENYFRTHFKYRDNAEYEYGFYIKMHYENRRELSAGFIEKIFRFQVSQVDRIIERGIQTGEIRRDTDKDQITFILITILEQVARDYFYNYSVSKRGNIEIRIKKILELIYRGIKR